MSGAEISFANRYGNSAINLCRGDITKYLIYSGKVLSRYGTSILDVRASFFILECIQKDIRNSIDITFLSRIKSMLLLCSSLRTYNNMGPWFDIVGNLKSLIPFVCPIANEEKPASNRVCLLASRVCGVGFAESITTLHSGMSMPKFLWVSALMREAKLTKLAYGFNEYIFMHLLLLRDNVESYFDRLPFEIKVELISFISAKDFSKNIKDLPPVADAVSMHKTNAVPYHGV